MSKKQFGLGKGLGALLGDAAESTRSSVGYINKTIIREEAEDSPAAGAVAVDIDLIDPNPYQPRKTFDPVAIDELAQSIRTHGLIQPITLRQLGDRYQIISGERRFRASIKAGLKEIPAYVRTASDQGMLEMAIVENIQRENLDPIELASSYSRLIEECSLTQEQLSERVGKSRVAVTNSLRLLRLPAKVQHDIKIGLVSVGHAKALLSLEDPQLQEAIADEIVKKGLSVRQTEELVRSATKEKVKPAEQELPELYYRFLERIGHYFGDNISLRRSRNGSGSLTIRFSDDQQIESLLNALDQNAS